MAIALVTVWAAIAISYQTNWPIGFFVGTIGAVAYGVGRMWAAWRTRRAGPASPDGRQAGLPGRPGAVGLPGAPL